MKQGCYRVFLSLVAVRLFFCGTAAANEKQPERLNVILILTDDQGYGDLACHGNPVIQTPNLDGFYKQSLHLTNFHVDPTCSPTRSALMTGRYSSRTGVWHTVMGRSLLRKDETTMADVFAANGYRTGIFGKWHLGDNYPYRPQHRGFHEVLTLGGGGVGQTPDFWGNNCFDNTFLHNGKLTKYPGYCTDVFFAAGMQFIEQNKVRPFFAYIPTNTPHAPYNVAERYSKPYRDRGVPEQRASFYGMIANIDENVGKLLARLKEWNLENNTLVIFMTDNGSAAGYRENPQDGFNAGMRGAKGSEYDGGHRVPCFICLPGNRAGGHDIGRITAHIDILPTLIDYCGLKKPQNVTFDGASLRPLFDRPKEWTERTLFVHSQRIDHPEKWRKCAVMTDRWRLVNGKELYDMTADPGQRKDVADQYPKIVADLRRKYEAWYADLSKRFDEYCAITIGSNKENPTGLCCHDWHGAIAPSGQEAVRRVVPANGFWAVDAARAGKYEITLRQQPAEAHFPISAHTARLKIGDREWQKPVPSGATSVTFPVELMTGETRLQTWLLEKTGETHGAYYVSVHFRE
jgi:arylsulfatase A-like enzyme